MKKLTFLILWLSCIMCSAQYYLPISTFTNYTNTAFSPVGGVISNATLNGITTATNLGASTRVTNLTVVGIATINVSNLVARGTTTATNINTFFIYSTNGIISLVQSNDTFGTTSLMMKNRGGVNGAQIYNYGLDLSEFVLTGSGGVDGNFRFEHRGSGNYRSAANATGELQGFINTVPVYGFGTSVAFFTVPVQTSSITNTGGYTGTGNITNTGSYNSPAAIITSSPISCNVVTNNGFVWYTVSNSTAANGSLLTLTDAFYFRVTNGWFKLK